jgi:DNA-binding transcriptional regulator YiaG/nicotinamidase-related amidase
MHHNGAWKMTTTQKANPPPENLTPADIRRIRERLGLNQVEAGELLGGGVRAFQKYESGTVTPAATTINLLRILDADPTALGTLTGTATPIQQRGLRPFEVTGAHISALSDVFLVALVRRLLSGEAARHQLPPDRIHVASTLTAADGGEDARIVWEGGPDRTPFLPSRDCLLQAKATGMTPSRAAKDVLTSAGVLEPLIREVLEAGGTYMMLCNRPYVRKAIVEREAKVREAVRAQGVTIKTAQVVFRDADQIATWVNELPQVATWILEQTQPGQATTLRTWTHWAGRHEHEFPYVEDERLADLRDQLRPAIDQERVVTRVVGLSGVGKSRLVLEALADDELNGLQSSHLVLYGVETELGSTAVKAAVQHLADLGRRAVVVIDRCSLETHNDLAAMVKRSSSNLSLITIDHEIPGGSLPPGVLLIDQASDSVIEAVINNMAPGLPSEDRRRLVKFANGFPQMAALSVEAWVADVSLATISSDHLIDQVVAGRLPINRQEVLQTAKLVSAFGMLGFRDEADVELELAAPYSGGLTVDQLRRNLADLQRRRVAQARGRFLTIQPRPIAHSLAERQWQEWGKDTWDAILTETPARLRERAARQVAQLNRSQIALDVTHHVLRHGGPLDSFEALDNAANATVVDYLAQVDAQATGDLISRVLEGVETAELENFEGPARSEIRWAVQRIAFPADTFELGAHLLLKLALAENETYSNNCTGQFKALFPAYLADTAADGEARLRFLDELIDRHDPSIDRLIVGALESGAEVQSFSRSVGIESHGLRAALEPWNPSNRDARAYIRQCLDRLLAFALRKDEIGKVAKQLIANDLRALVLHGFLDFAEEAVTAITQADGSYWPSALGSLGDVISYDLAEAPPDIEPRVRQLIALVSPSDLRGRLRLLVTEMPWDYPCDEKLDFEEREIRQRDAIYELACEALSSPVDLEAALPELCSGPQRMANLFGMALAGCATDKALLLWAIFRAVKSVPTAQRSSDLLTSVLAELSKSRPQLVETFKRRAIRSPSLSSMVPLLAFRMGISAADVLQVRDGLASGSLKVDALYSWTFGGRLAQREPSEVAPLFDELFASEAGAYFGYDLIGMYAHGRRDRLEQLRPQIRKAAEWAVSSPSNTMNDHHFSELMTWMLQHGRTDEDARAVALSLTRQFVEKAADNTLADERRIRPLLPLLLREFPEIAWPLIGQAITANPKAAWRFQFTLGKGTSFGRASGAAPLLELSADTLMAWCHANPEVAPGFLASVLPLLGGNVDEGQTQAFHPLLRRLIDDFGEREDVQNALVSNMNTFGWSGSISTYYELYQGPLASLSTHPRPGVRRWARRMSDQISRQIAHAQDEDEEHEAQFD